MDENVKVEEQNTTEPKKEVTVQKTNKLEANWESGIYGSSDNFNLAYQMAKGLSESTIVPIQFQKNPSNCLIAIEQSQRLNCSPMMVMQNLHIIQNKPSWSSSFLIALINGSGKYDMELQFDTENDKNGKPFSCLCWTEKNGRRIEGMTVDMDMANAEGWVSKNGSKWKTMPALMLRYRAAAFFARLNCPELTLGFYTKEEMNDWNEPSNGKSKASLNDMLKQEEDIYVEAVQLNREVVDEV